jgi:transposase InsO family protein
MDERPQFIADHQRGLYTMTELCERYGVSRKTGYKWLTRYHAEGALGLQARSHAPKHCPHRIDAELSALLCTARRAHPTWGPEKLVQYLAPRHPERKAWPAVSTVADLLKREGLVRPRRRRRRTVHPGVGPIHTTQPNDLWTADFKGHFKTRDGLYCYPLTIADQHTRYLVGIQGLLSTKAVGARRVFERVFREHGLPLRSAPTTACPSPTRAPMA